MSDERYERYGIEGETNHMYLLLLNVKLRLEGMLQAGVSVETANEILKSELLVNRTKHWPLTLIIEAIFPSLGDTDDRKR